MGLRARYRQLPQNPFRPGRRDVLVGFAGAVISGMVRYRLSWPPGV